MNYRSRNLETLFRAGGRVTEVRLVESVDGLWTIWLRLSDRTGERRLCRYKSDDPKVYRDLGLAVAAVRDDFRYWGPIVLSTDRGELI